MLVVFTRFASAVIYFNLLLWHIYCLSLHIPCILLSVTSSLFSELWDYFEMTSRPLSFSWVRGTGRPDLDQSWIPSRFSMSCVTWSFCCLFLLLLFFWTWKSTKIQGLLAFNVSYTDHTLILEINAWKLRRNWERECLLRLLKGLARAKAENNKYFGLKLPHKCRIAQVLCPSQFSRVGSLSECPQWNPYALQVVCRSGAFTGFLCKVDLRWAGWKQLELPKSKALSHLGWQKMLLFQGAESPTLKMTFTQKILRQILRPVFSRDFCLVKNR